MRGGRRGQDAGRRGPNSWRRGHRWVEVVAAAIEVARVFARGVRAPAGGLGSSSALSSVRSPFSAHPLKASTASCACRVAWSPRLPGAARTAMSRASHAVSRGEDAVQSAVGPGRASDQRWHREGRVRTTLRGFRDCRENTTAREASRRSKERTPRKGASTHDNIGIVSTSSVSFPPGFFGGRLGTYSPLFVLSLLLQLFVLISLLSWPFEAFSSSRMFDICAGADQVT